MKEMKNGKVIDLVQIDENMSYVKDGEIITDKQMQSIMVESETDLTLLTAFAPGTIAFTAGYEEVWQKAADGTWTQFIGGSE